jgi:hypothetical protein
MKHAHGIILFTLAISLLSCAKESREVAQDLGLVPAGCGTEGMRLDVSVDGNTYCPDATLVAIGSGGSVMISGVDLLGTTLVLQLDESTVGQHVITEAANSVLYMHLGSTFTVAPGVEGSLVISAHDPATRRLQGSFQVSLFNELNGQTRQVAGDLDVTWTEE